MAYKYKTGDTVRFLNDIGGGTVIRVDEGDMVVVLTGDGFEIPVPARELVIAGTFSSVEKETLPEPKNEKEVAPGIRGKSKSIPSEEPEIPRNIPSDTPVNLLIGIIPEQSGPVFNSRLACYLINDSPYYAYYLIGTKEKGGLYYLASGMIESETKCFVKSFDQTGISKISDFHVQIMWLSRGRYNRMAPVDDLVNINMVNFSKESYYRVNDYFEEKALLFDIRTQDTPSLQDLVTVTEEVIEEKVQADLPKEVKIKKKEPVSDTMEIDLHTEAMDLDIGNPAPAEILKLQMSRFHSAMEEAISKSMRRLVIIHGLGQGTLKMQIRKDLQEKYPRYIFQDASFKEYGFGATMVHLTLK